LNIYKFIETAVFHFGVDLGVLLLVKYGMNGANALFKYFFSKKIYKIELIHSFLKNNNNKSMIRYNYVNTAIIVSSFGKSISILMAIWDYKDIKYSWWVNLFVFTSNVEALHGKKYDSNFDYFFLLPNFIFFKKNKNDSFFKFKIFSIIFNYYIWITGSNSLSSYY